MRMTSRISIEYRAFLVYHSSTVVLHQSKPRRKGLGGGYTRTLTTEVASLGVHVLTAGPVSLSYGPRPFRDNGCGLLTSTPALIHGSKLKSVQRSLWRQRAIASQTRRDQETERDDVHLGLGGIFFVLLCMLFSVAF